MRSRYCGGEGKEAISNYYNNTHESIGAKVISAELAGAAVRGKNMVVCAEVVGYRCRGDGICDRGRRCSEHRSRTMMMSGLRLWAQRQIHGRRWQETINEVFEQHKIKRNLKNNTDLLS